MNYLPTVLNECFSIDKLYTVHYFEFSKNYSFEGESHPFWEFVYVDKGEADIIAGERKYHLTKGQIVFHKPNEFHTVMGNGVTAPNLLIVSFQCDSPAMSFFEDRISVIGDSEKVKLAKIIQESALAFSTPLDDPMTKCLERNNIPAAEQYIKINLEGLLLDLYTKKESVGSKAPSSLLRENSQNETFEKIVKYMEDNIDKQLKLNGICKDNLVGRSYLQKLFREKTGGPVDRPPVSCYHFINQ